MRARAHTLLGICSSTAKAHTHTQDGETGIRGEMQEGEELKEEVFRGAYRAETPLLELHTGRRRGEEAEMESGSHHLFRPALSNPPRGGESKREFHRKVAHQAKQFFNRAPF